MTKTPAPPGTDGTPVDNRSRELRGDTKNRRRSIEIAILGVCAVVTIGLLGFLLADWLRDSIAFADLWYRQYLAIGAWIDYYFGTIVFGFSSTWRAISAGVMIGLVAPVIGSFLIHRQMALIGETLAHTAFAGVAAGVVLVGLTGWTGSLLLVELGSQGGLLFVALVVSAIGALGLQWLSQHSQSYGDVPIAIVLAGSFALGTLLISWARDFAPITVDVEGFLFGSLAIVTTEGARLIALLSLVVLGLVITYYKQFVFITFDEEAARVARLPVRGYNTLLVVMTAVVVVGAMQILGVILVAAMLVVPAAAASQLALSFRETVRLSIIFGQAAAVIGLLFSLLAGLPPGGSIVLVAIGMYVLTVVVSGRSTSGLSAY